MPNEVFIYDALRVPTGKKGGFYKNILSEDLTAFLLDTLREKNSDLVKDVSEIILGNSIGTLGNMARYALLKSSFKKELKASTVDLQCGGTYQSLRLAKSLISSGEATKVIAGGMESNSLMPMRIYHKNDPRYINNDHINVAKFAPNSQIDLLESAEKLANKYNVSKREMTNWAVQSHQKALTYSQFSIYNKHVIPFSDKGIIDQTIKTDLSVNVLERLADNRLIDRTNTADYHDGAGILLLSNKVDEAVKPLCKIIDVEITGIDPDQSPEGCIIAVEKLLIKNSIRLSEIDSFEVNESFACKPLAFSKHFNLPLANINTLGGNLAMGHPYAASGVINLINLISTLKLNKKKYGLVSAGIAGGFGAAVLIENVF
jgi:acetyl-CoA C-acetyltransferase